jgi:type II secretory pathway pseudopilin PulG
MLNNKGFTVVELIMSFVFSSILAVSLFAVILNYRDKQIDTSIQTKLLAFKSELIIDVQQDIQRLGLRSIDYCTNSSGGRVSRCIVLSFMNGTSKQFKVQEEPKVDTLDNLDGVSDSFYYTVPFISYGDMKYTIPDAANVYIRNDFLLEKTTLSDGLETNTSLYKIRVNLAHNDLDADMDISIVAEGTTNLNTSSAPYKTYNIGDSVIVFLNKNTQKKFRVIKRSGGYDGNVVLLYDDTYDSLVLGSTKFNNSRSDGNVYSSSYIQSKVDTISNSWTNANVVRLATAEEIGYLVAACPKFRSLNANNVDIATAASWINSGKYWTMSPKEVSSGSTDKGKLAWYVDGTSKKIASAYVDSSYAIRPVIEISKSYLDA